MEILFIVILLILIVSIGEEVKKEIER